MKQIYEVNGLVCWEQADIILREALIKNISYTLEQTLRLQNKAWIFHQIEASVLTPQSLLHPNYNTEDVWGLSVDDGETLLMLRPETTQGSYTYARQLLEAGAARMPLCIWQVGKSFRREQIQPTKHMRLKEFYQMEFQCIYGLTTANDYSIQVIPAIQKAISKFIGPCRVEPSDRIPDYADWTQDIVFEMNEMEVCSISLRHDFENAKVLEVAIGIDRLIYCHGLT